MLKIEQKNQKKFQKYFLKIIKITSKKNSNREQSKIDVKNGQKKFYLFFDYF